MVVVGRKKHLRLVFEPAERRAVQYARFVSQKIQPERIAFHGKSATERLAAFFCKGRKLFLV
jgi:hypothetical protein